MAKRKRTSKIAAQVADPARKKKPVEEDNAIFIPTGSTLFNLALSDRTNGGFKSGTVVNTIGDKSTGKTFLFLTMCAELANRSKFDDYGLYHDSVEGTVSIDIPSMFGNKMYERLLDPPEYHPSKTIEDSHANIVALTQGDKPFIYGLDSFDALSSDEEVAYVKKKMKARGTAEKTSGSFGQGKTRELGVMFRQITNAIEETRSLFNVISQVRQNMDGGLYSPKFTRTGGQALGHYATHEVWLNIMQKIKRKDQVIGVMIRAKITKNRVTGKQREVTFPLYYEYGVDDIGSCIDFIMKTGYWKKRKNTIIAKGLNQEATREKLIQYVEDNNKEARLRKETGKAWRKFEDSLSLNRKKKYE